MSSSSALAPASWSSCRIKQLADSSLDFLIKRRAHALLSLSLRQSRALGRILLLHPHPTLRSRLSPAVLHPFFSSSFSPPHARYSARMLASLALSVLFASSEPLLPCPPLPPSKLTLPFQPPSLMVPPGGTTTSSSAKPSPPPPPLLPPQPGRATRPRPHTSL